MIKSVDTNIKILDKEGNISFMCYLDEGCICVAISHLDSVWEAINEGRLCCHSIGEPFKLFKRGDTEYEYKHFIINEIRLDHANDTVYITPTYVDAKDYMNIEIGEIYSTDDSMKKVIYKNADMVIAIEYSCNHKVYSVGTYSRSDFTELYVNEKPLKDSDSTFENLHCCKAGSFSNDIKQKEGK